MKSFFGRQAGKALMRPMLAIPLGAGKVGIGTNNPAEKLHVAGNLRVDGTSVISAISLCGEN